MSATPTCAKPAPGQAPPVDFTDLLQPRTPFPACGTALRPARDGRPEPCPFAGATIMSRPSRAWNICGPPHRLWRFLALDWQAVLRTLAHPGRPETGGHQGGREAWRSRD